MSDTPRTDAASSHALEMNGQCVHSDFARKLERELAAKERELEDARKLLSFQELHKSDKIYKDLTTLQQVARELLPYAEKHTYCGSDTSDNPFYIKLHKALTTYTNLPPEVKGIA